MTTVVSNPDPFSTVAHLHLDKCSLVPKPGHPMNETFDETRQRLKSLVTIPALLDEQAEAARLAIQRQYGYGHLPTELQAIVLPEVPPTEWVEPTAKRNGDWLSFAEVTAFGGENPRKALTLEEEVAACFKNLQGESLPTSYGMVTLAESQNAPQTSSPHTPPTSSPSRT